MAENPANGIGWLLELRRDNAEWLAGIRHWQHLKTATEEGRIWIKGFRGDEIDSVPVRSIPSKNVWRQKDNLLFAQGSIVPSRKAPSLLWTPIERGLPLELPPWNHNFFGLPDTIPMRLIPSSAERRAAGMMAPLNQLQDFAKNVSSLRLKALTWTMLDAGKALILGSPLLPLPGGVVFWRKDDFLIPAGYDFEWAELAGYLPPMLQRDAPSIILWHPEGDYSGIPKRSFRQLSAGSVRQSLSLMPVL